jgi:hypothetical protein
MVPGTCLGIVLTVLVMYLEIEISFEIALMVLGMCPEIVLRVLEISPEIVLKAQEIALKSPEMHLANVILLLVVAEISAMEVCANLEVIL